jgi:hypothetical protein
VVETIKLVLWDVPCSLLNRYQRGIISHGTIIFNSEMCIKYFYEHFCLNRHSAANDVQF